MKPARILVVDDTPRNVKLLAELLTGSGYDVATAATGAEALEHVAGRAGERPDLVLLDVLMPGLSGYDVCRAIRADTTTATLPVVMVTALEASAERVAGIEAGADDFLSKPISQPELLARVRALLRAKELHDTVQRQAEQLAELNRTLEERVATQLAELERLGRLKRFLPPQIVERVVAGDADDPLSSHRRDIAAVFLELRGLTLYAETRAPDEVMAVLRDYHDAVGGQVSAFQGTLERFTGDGIAIFFNDPVPQPDAAERAVRMALAIRERCREPFARWEEHGFELSVGIGVSRGVATLGAIGFESRSDYAAIGAVTRLAARLCEAAQPNEILISPPVLAAVEPHVHVEPAGELSLRGFLRRVAAYRVTAARLRAAAATPGPVAQPGRRVFRREGDYWTLCHGDEEVRLRDSKGLFYIAQLLRAPEQEIPATVLVARLRTAGGPHDASDGAAAADDTQATQLADLRAELDQAESFNDAGRARRLREQIELLARRRAASAGLAADGDAGASERARVNVTRAISDAVKRIREHAPALARHLDASVRTGALCSYRPPDDTTWEP